MLAVSSMDQNIRQPFGAVTGCGVILETRGTVGLGPPNCIASLPSGLKDWRHTLGDLSPCPKSTIWIPSACERGGGGQWGLQGGKERRELPN